MPTKNYYWRHRDKCIADVVRWKSENPEQAKKNSRESAARVRATADGRQRSLKASRKFRSQNKEECNRLTREWRSKNKGYHSRWHAANKKKNPVLYMWRNCRNRAKALGIEFSIQQSDIVVPESCPVLGIKLTFNHGKKGFFCNESPSVDRYDNSKGYTPENIRVISWRANMLKRDGTLDEFRKIVAYMEHT